MQLSKSPKCPHCNYATKTDEELGLTEVQGKMVCPKCKAKFYFDTEVIIYYKSFKTMSEYVSKKEPVCENFKHLPYQSNNFLSI